MHARHEVSLPSVRDSISEQQLSFHDPLVAACRRGRKMNGVDGQWLRAVGRSTTGPR